MKKCINCGNSENNNAAVCSKCGGVLIKNSVNCINCGAEIDGDVAFCTYCGAPTKGEPSPYLYEKAPERVVATEKKSKGKGVLITLTALVCILLVVCFVLVVYLISDKKNNSSQNENNPENPSREQSETVDDTDFIPEEEPEKKESTYEIYVSDNTWTKANAEAKRLDGNLVCVNNEEEFDKVCQMAEENDITAFWMGARRSDDDQSWDDVNWKNGDEMNYTKWLDGEPSYEEDGVAEKYLMAFKVGETWYFNDGINDISTYYSGNMGYIVEFEN